MSPGAGTIYVPDDAAGNETLVRLLPELWRIARSQQQARRGHGGEGR